MMKDEVSRLTVENRALVNKLTEIQSAVVLR